MKVRVGFATTSGILVDQHFGSARYWQVYDFDESDAELVEERMTKPSCQGHCEGGFDDILKTLSDCDAMVCAKIGDGAAAYVISKGKRVFEAAGNLDQIVEVMITQDLLGTIREEKERR